jgi:hypothetical protein
MMWRKILRVLVTMIGGALLAAQFTVSGCAVPTGTTETEWECKGQPGKCQMLMSAEECNAALGCEAKDICEPVLNPCNAVDEAHCALEANCEWDSQFGFDGKCVPLEHTCYSRNGLAECEADSNCRWLEYCAGSPPPCKTLGEADCDTLFWCSWSVKS